jgi:Arc/MetJ-type ribon-helix-helix transcriptional regulator
MKSLTVRLPAALIAEIEAESRGRNISKSDVIRERLQWAQSGRAPLEAIADVVGSVDGLPADLSSRTKHYLRSGGHDGKHPP